MEKTLDVCAVISCSTTSDDEIRLFSFPENEEIQQKWINFCQNNRLKAFSTSYLCNSKKICAKHFDLSHIVRDEELNCKCLKPEALPVLNGPQFSFSDDSSDEDEAVSDIELLLDKSATSDSGI